MSPMRYLDLHLGRTVSLDCRWDRPWDDGLACMVVEIDTADQSVRVALVGDRETVLDTAGELGRRLQEVVRRERLYT